MIIKNKEVIVNIKIEVCLDNIESVDNVTTVGIDRIEMCSSLALGGISPNESLVKYAKDTTKISLHSMIRPRSGDFTYSEKEINVMEYEINSFADMGVDGVVFGILNLNNELDLKSIERLFKLAKTRNLYVTFHRAFDYVNDHKKALKDLIDLGINRILTSGKADTAIQGLSVIKELVELASNRIEIMAGSGVTADNVKEIIEKTSVKSIHCSASEKKNKFDKISLKLGGNSSDLSYQCTSLPKLESIKKACRIC